MDALGQFIWVILVSFLFLAYLIVLFWILADLFSDHKLSGWWKAVWIVFLVLVPFITALVYMIARGRGMQARQAASNKAAKDATDSYIRKVAEDSPADQIAKAKALLDNGTITEAEYQQLKMKALA